MIFIIDWPPEEEKKKRQEYVRFRIERLSLCVCRKQIKNVPVEIFMVLYYCCHFIFSSYSFFFVCVWKFANSKYIYSAVGDLFDAIWLSNMAAAEWDKRALKESRLRCGILCWIYSFPSSPHIDTKYELHFNRYFISIYHCYGWVVKKYWRVMADLSNRKFCKMFKNWWISEASVMMLNINCGCVITKLSEMNWLDEAWLYRIDYSTLVFSYFPLLMCSKGLFWYQIFEIEFLELLRVLRSES